MSSTRPPRDPIVQEKPGTAGGSVSRSDKLNGENRTRSISGGGPNFSKTKDPTSGFPCPNDPY